MTSLRPMILTFCTVIATSISSLQAQDFKLKLKVSVAEPKEESSLDLVPTQISLALFDRNNPQVDVNGPMLTQYYRQQGELITLPNAENKESSSAEYTISKFSVGGQSRYELFFRGTGLDVFRLADLIQVAALNRSVCGDKGIDTKQNTANCQAVFPAVQTERDIPAKVSSILLRVFVKGSVNTSQLKTVAQDQKKFLELYSRNASLRKDKSAYDGYFYYAGYNFSKPKANAPAKKEGSLNENVYQWNYSLEKAKARLALLPAATYLEKEVRSEDGDSEIQSSSVDLKWGQFIASKDLNWKIR